MRECGYTWIHGICRLPAGHTGTHHADGRQRVDARSGVTWQAPTTRHWPCPAHTAVTR